MDTVSAYPASGQSFFDSCALMSAGALTGLHSHGQRSQGTLPSQGPGQCASVIYLESFGEKAPHLVNFV